MVLFSKTACINIKNKDDKCLLYAVQCGVYEIYNKPHPERQGIITMINSKKKYQQVNMLILIIVIFQWKLMMM